VCGGIFNLLQEGGLDGISVFQRAKYGETKQIQETCAPFNLGVHCVFHKTNLVK
jgi:hypothetical protein